MVADLLHGAGNSIITVASIHPLMKLENVVCQIYRNHTVASGRQCHRCAVEGEACGVNQVIGCHVFREIDDLWEVLI